MWTWKSLELLTGHGGVATLEARNQADQIAKTTPRNRHATPTSRLLSALDAMDMSGQMELDRAIRRSGVPAARFMA